MRLREATRRSQPIHLGGRRSTRRWRIASAWAHGRTKGGRSLSRVEPPRWLELEADSGRSGTARIAIEVRPWGGRGRTSVSTASRSARRAVRSGVSVRLDGLSRELLAGGELDESIQGRVARSAIGRPCGTSSRRGGSQLRPFCGPGGGRLLSWSEQAPREGSPGRRQARFPDHHRCGFLTRVAGIFPSEQRPHSLADAWQTWGPSQAWWLGRHGELSSAAATSGTSGRFLPWGGRRTRPARPPTR